MFVTACSGLCYELFNNLSQLVYPIMTALYHYLPY